VRRDDVDETEDGYKRHTDEPHDDLLPQRQRLHEAHLRAVPDARQMLLAVGMRHKLHTGAPAAHCNTRMAHSRAHASVKVADGATLLPLNKRRG